MNMNDFLAAADKELERKMDVFKFCTRKKWKVCCYYSLCIFVKKPKITVLQLKSLINLISVIVTAKINCN